MLATKKVAVQPADCCSAPFTGVRGRCSRSAVRCRATAAQQQDGCSRRESLARAAALGAALVVLRPAAPSLAASLPVEAIDDTKLLCNADCVAGLESKELVTTPSGLQYRDIVVGTGPKPVVGFQVVCHYVAMTDKGRVFESSLEKGKPYDIRVGGGQVIPGLDEGLRTMRVGGVRRLYIPGELAFPKGLKAAAGRPSVPPKSPVIFDVNLLYIPGFDDE